MLQRVISRQNGVGKVFSKGRANAKSYSCEVIELPGHRGASLQSLEVTGVGSRLGLKPMRELPMPTHSSIGSRSVCTLFPPNCT